MRLIRELVYLHKLKKNQWKKYDELINNQNKKIRYMVDYAYNHVPFYKELFKKENIHPTDIKNAKDLNKIPLVSKEDLKNNFPDKIMSNEFDYKRCKIWDTSGSTGIPLKIAYEKKADDFARAVLLRSYFSLGLKYFDKWCYIAPDEFKDEKEKGYFFTEKIGFISPYYISIFLPIEKKIELLKKFKPRILESLATDLYLIARYIKENNIKGINPEITISNGELLDDYMRNYIKNVFNVDHFDVYGCMELRRNAWECQYHEGYHIDIDSIVMQFIKDEEDVSPGEKGNIVFTGLFNYAMPLIRYDIGDVGIPSSHMCSCGRGLPMMEILKGKLMDFILTTDGKLLSPHIFKRILMETDGIELFKLVQLNKDKIKILIVKNERYLLNQASNNISSLLKQLLGQDISVEIEFVDEIKRQGRKYKVIESKLNTIKL